MAGQMSGHVSQWSQMGWSLTRCRGSESGGPMNNELVIIGAGPAGLTAAREAASHGVKVLILDENDRPGGQLFTQTHKFFGSKEHMASIRGFQIGQQLLEELSKLDVEISLNTVALGVFPDKKVMFVKGEDKVRTVDAKAVLLATGALEKPLIFKGWTLPGVMGAGAAQTMMNISRVLPGKKALMLGSGNVGLIVSYQLKQAGCKVVGVLEVLPKISGYKVHASKIRRAGIPILTSHTIKEAKGKDFVESAVITKVELSANSCKPVQGSEMEIECDLICIAAGLQPFSELCWQLDLKMQYVSALGGFVPAHDEYLQTSMPDIYIAGDIAGIEEASTAMEEGRLAGKVVAWRLGYLNKNEFNSFFNEISARLSELRLGSFGIEREKGKKLLLDSSSAI
jgi:NADPH-dependent 2,4-dienoyl-CoA reductase/sulfur reductase-like enzyme